MKWMTVGLQGLEFYAYHGVFAEERMLGNRYIVEVELHCSVDTEAGLAGTVDYSEAYRVVAERMAEPTPLLETLAYDMAIRLLQLPRVGRATIKVAKQQPPLGGLCSQSYVQLTLPQDVS